MLLQEPTIIMYQEPDNILQISEKDRKKFITKTYCCINFQLIATFGLTLLSKIYNFSHFYESDIGRGILGLSILSILCSICFTQSIFPYNVLNLLLFTFGISYSTSWSLINIDNLNIIAAGSVTILDTFFLTFLSLFWNFNISYMNQFLSVCLFTLVITSLINIFIMSNFLQLVIAGSGSVIFSGFILYDTKTIICNNTREYTKYDYVSASINLYLDILNLFLYVLQCLILTDNN